MFLAKFDAVGNPLWSRSVNDLPWGPSHGGHLALDPAGHLYWVTQDDYSIVVRVYQPDEGYILWMKRIEVPSEAISDDQATIYPDIGLSGFAMAPDGRFALTGSFTSTIDFGDGPVSAISLLDAYFAVLAP